MKKLLYIPVVCLLLFTLQAQAGRLLPIDAKAGELKSHQYPQVVIDDKVYHVAPGARVFDEANRIIQSGNWPQNAKVFYRTDPSGDLIQMWLATPEDTLPATQ